MNLKQILFILSSVLLVSITIFSEEKKLSFEVELNKSEYLLMEPVIIDVILTNITSGKISTSYLCPICKNGSLDFEILDRNGDLLNYSGAIASLGNNGSTFLLEPKQKYQKSFNLLEYFGLYEKDLFSSIYFRYLLPGKYTLNVTYSGSTAQKLEFEVVEPTGEKKEEFNTMKKAYIQKRETGSNEVFREFIDKYPYSVYIEKILKDSNRYNILLNRFPNSGFSDLILKSLVRQLPSNEQHEFLNSIISNNPNSRSAKYAKQILKEQLREKINEEE